MKKFIAVALLSLISLTGCGNNPINVNTFKPYFQLAADTFVAAMVVTNPTWNDTKLVGDVTALVTDWNTGTNWQTNAITELGNIKTDVADIPNCNTECVALSGVFTDAIATGIALSEPPAPAKGAMVARRAVTPAGKIYTNTDDYKKAWNKVAPKGHKL